ncbi:PREDICTED: transmembrane protein 222 [Nicrophorus vespilloides]|uniref:Transmembrane protein 222 n=1 Tax=Nicrophorus vespilloides TaxID=110193 RepID=A0ABM1NEM5_NICVS|nr:PREDICTED: transmembrane protein 222 [Nicrophorus vespilloides]
MVENGEMEYNSTFRAKIDKSKDRYPFCIVWTPIPLLTWLFPFIGHMGIALSSGVIRDFDGPYHVSEDNFGFGRPAKYWMLDPSRSRGGVSGWDAAVTEASDIYKLRPHNIFCDNCHSHVAMAMNMMQYSNKTNWNMFWLAAMMLSFSKYVNFWGFIKTWLPFAIISTTAIILYLYV